jgi:hypothetical protein
MGQPRKDVARFLKVVPGRRTYLMEGCYGLLMVDTRRGVYNMFVMVGALLMVTHSRCVFDTRLFPFRLSFTQ